MIGTRVSIISRSLGPLQVTEAASQPRWHVTCSGYGGKMRVECLQEESRALVIQINADGMRSRVPKRRTGRAFPVVLGN